MRIQSWQLIALLLVTSLSVTLFELPRQDWFTMAAMSLTAGVAAFSLMGVAALLGGRLSPVETLFGGLDRVYRVHKWLGIWALILASFHLMFKAGMEGWDVAPLLELSPYWTRLIRQSSYAALVLIIVLALNRNIPYGTWRIWHKLSGPLFVIVVLHALSIKTPFALQSPGGAWIIAVAALGLLAALYKLVLYPRLAEHGEYQVVSVEPGAAAIRLELAPVGKPITFKPGQFGFLRMKEDGLREPHPFTIASDSSPRGNLHFVIRALGDYTQRLLKEAAVGMHADVYAPYGRFEREPGAKQEIWIAGGVGITPFIAWLKDSKAGELGNVALFYFFTPGREFPSAAQLQALAAERGAHFIPVAGGPTEAAFTSLFKDKVKEAGAENISVRFCGPNGLLDEIRILMRENRIPESRLRYEFFEFR